eukprot:Colp12_sorted_trinity150504_noHs@32853
MTGSSGEGQHGPSQRTRDLIAFWILGLTNNYAYVIMLSAAHDILEGTDGVSTGVILLADILPTLIIKIFAPFFMQKIPYTVRVIAVIFFALASFIIVAFSESIGLSIFGVICASISAGSGEITFLSLSSFYHRNTVSAWSSGTGGAGAIGSISYAGLTMILSPRHTLLVMTVMPVLMFLSYFFLLSKHELHVEEADPLLDNAPARRVVPARNLAFKEKVQLLKPLLRYMVPLFFVYYAEYCINQGVSEHIFWDDMFLSHSGQYRWYQAIYQIGVFISRSSVNIVQIKRLWLPAVIQIGLFVFLFCDATYAFLPSIYLVFCIILFEGFLGGGAYVNAFYNISHEIAPEHREFSLGVTSVADSFGIALAGATAIGLNDFLRPRATAR